VRQRLSLLIFVFALALLVGCGPPAAPPAPLPSVLPGVAVQTLAGDAVTVGQAAGGRAALVTLWATWCEACLRESDALNRLAGTGAQVIGVAVGEDRAKVAAFARLRGMRYAQLVDEGFAFADAVGQRRVPATLVIDGRGRIVYRGDALDAAALDALRSARAGE
jgi:thiol-disulfide isomerase/thioredoxin